MWWGSRTEAHVSDCVGVSEVQTVLVIPDRQLLEQAVRHQRWGQVPWPQHDVPPAHALRSI